MCALQVIPLIEWWSCNLSMGSPMLPGCCHYIRPKQVQDRIALYRFWEIVPPSDNFVDNIRIRYPENHKASRDNHEEIRLDFFEYLIFPPPVPVCFNVTDPWVDDETGEFLEPGS